MKLYECISKIMARGTNIAYRSAEDNAAYLRMIDLRLCSGTGRKKRRIRKQKNTSKQTQMFLVVMIIERAKELYDNDSNAFRELRDELVKQIKDAGEDPNNYLLTAYHEENEISMTATLKEE